MSHFTYPGVWISPIAQSMYSYKSNDLNRILGIHLDPRPSFGYYAIINTIEPKAIVDFIHKEHLYVLYADGKEKRLNDIPESEQKLYVSPESVFYVIVDARDGIGKNGYEKVLRAWISLDKSYKILMTKDISTALLEELNDEEVGDAVYIAACNDDVGRLIELGRRSISDKYKCKNMFKALKLHNISVLCTLLVHYNNETEHLINDEGYTLLQASVLEGYPENVRVLSYSSQINTGRIGCTAWRLALDNISNTSNYMLIAEYLCDSSIHKLLDKLDKNVSNVLYKQTNNSISLKYRDTFYPHGNEYSEAYQSIWRPLVQIELKRLLPNENELHKALDMEWIARCYSRHTDIHRKMHDVLEPILTNILKTRYWIFS